MKRCPRCQQTKPRDCFDPDKSRSDGRYSYCKQCRLDYNRQWRAANPVKAREAARRRAIWARGRRAEYGLSYSDVSRLKKYGGTPDDYGRLLTQQGGLCRICGCTPAERGTRLDIDHCHETATVRGLLCGPCNRGLGSFRDNAALLRAAASYLEEARQRVGEQPGAAIVSHVDPLLQGRPAPGR